MLDLGKDAGGAFVDLSKEAGKDVERVVVKLTWDKQTTDGHPFDPDCVAFCLGTDGKVPNVVNGVSPWFVKGFGGKNVPNSPDNKVRHGGDDTSGAQGGEKIEIDAPLDALVEKVRIAVTIYQAAARKQNIGKIKNLTIAVLDADTGETLVTGQLNFDASTFISANAIDIFSRNGKLVVQYIGDGYNGGLGAICTDHGLSVPANNPYDN